MLGDLAGHQHEHHAGEDGVEGLPVVEIGTGHHGRPGDGEYGRRPYAPVDGGHGVLVVLACSDHEHADDGGQDPDGRDGDGEDHRLGRVGAPVDGAEGGDAEDDGGDDGDHVGLEEVGGHAGAVPDVVAHVVGDGGRVAGVVLRDAGLHLAHQVGTDVGRLGEDAAADPHEQGQQRRAEPEADEHRGGGVLEDEDDDRGPEEAEADTEQAGDGTGAVGHLEGRGHLALPGRRRGAHVAPYGQAHPDEAGEAGAQGPGQKADHPVETGLGEGEVGHRVAESIDVGHLGGGEEDEHGQGDDDDPDGLELPSQEGLRPLLDGLGDVFHGGRALVGGEDTPYQQKGHHDGGHGTQERKVQPGLLGVVEREDLVTPFSQEVGHRCGSLRCTAWLWSNSERWFSIGRGRPQASRPSVPLRSHGLWAVHRGAPYGTPFPATGGKDTDIRPPEQGSAWIELRQGHLPGVAGRSNRTDQVGSTSASGPAISS